MREYNHLQRQSRRMALCGLLAALSAVILSAGSLIPLATFACPMLAMLCLLPVLCEYGAGTALLVYTAVSVLALMLCADKELALFYLFLGWYPALRPRLARLPRMVGIPLKCALFTLSMTVMYSLIIYLFRLEAVVEEFAGYSTVMLIGLLVLGNATFFMLDVLLERMSRLYCSWKKH